MESSEFDKFIENIIFILTDFILVIKQCPIAWATFLGRLKNFEVNKLNERIVHYTNLLSDILIRMLKVTNHKYIHFDGQPKFIVFIV